MNCSNCFSDFTGSYCNHCGQKSGSVKYSMRGMITELFLSAFHVEKKGLFFTLRELTIQPGLAIQKVIKGQRLFLYPPFKYLVLLGTIVIIFSLRYKFFHNEYTQVESHENDLMAWLYLTQDNKHYLENFFRFAEDEATLLNIITIPIFALFSWAFLSRGKFNFAENLILNTYITAQQLCFLLVLVPFLEISPPLKIYLIPIYTVLTIIYNVWAYIQFFDGNKFWLGTRALLVVLLSYVYQLPINLGIYFLYHTYLHENFHWVPDLIIK